MRFLTVAERELRAAARRKGTYVIRWVTAAGFFLLLIWFFISFIGPELNWPNAALRLSALYYYGTPLLNGLQLTSVLGVVAVSAIALGFGALRFVRKDIGV